jgi:hypothetical protein
LAAHRLEDDQTISGGHLRYLYKQALYGYEEFGKKYASEEAQADYKRLGLPGQITQCQGHQQYQLIRAGNEMAHFTLMMFILFQCLIKLSAPCNKTKSQ